ncbi:hypothetical protein AOLI_G00123980 [Acnodon oligacanthus]
MFQIQATDVFLANQIILVRWKLIVPEGSCSHSPDMAEKCSAAEMHSSPERASTEASTTIRFSCTPVALAHHNPDGRGKRELRNMYDYL